jgi:hypothetical protein
MQLGRNEVWRLYGFWPCLRQLLARQFLWRGQRQSVAKAAATQNNAAPAAIRWTKAINSQ